MNRERGETMRAWLGVVFIAGLVAVGFTVSGALKEEIDQAKTIVEWGEEAVSSAPLSSKHAVTLTYKGGAEQLYLNGRRNDVSVNGLPNHIREAIIVIEDRKFNAHPGYDLGGIARAFINNANESSVQGGSTITQQLARNVYLTHERTYERKVKELMIARALEKNYSKKEIMTAYSNVIFFGHNVYGIQSAADTYFSRPLDDLNWNQIAYLLTVPNNPSLYDPLDPSPAFYERKDRILTQLRDAGVLSKQAYDAFHGVKLKASYRSHKVRYPDYMDTVMKDAVRLVRTRYDLDEEAAKNYLASNKATVETYLSVERQNQAKQVMSRLPNGLNGGYAELTPNGRIVALVDSDMKQSGEFNRATQAYRQPGSAIKPVLVFAPYIEETGATLDTVLDGRPVCYGTYCPTNSGNRVLGDVTLQDTIAYSYNTPALAAFTAIDQERAYETADMMFSQWDPAKDSNLASALGGLTQGVSPKELAAAYTPFLNKGVYVSGQTIKEIRFASGVPTISPDMMKQAVWSDETASAMQEALSAVTTYGTGRYAGQIKRPYVGGKTGTTNSHKDMWYVGLTDQTITAIWLGADTPRPFPELANRAYPAIVWTEAHR
ncbi:penicillin-binding protein [Exiguobacterium sp. SH3S2]|nr:penicillin-binding protein [Exiguobacterium sp. SH5S4]TCI44172.1 penicillin-binding protein [Exiguobacterium sp. SH3S3]TCI53135.1 penicillin-binding protein [Exiguobacterium sp. SH5S13]TCI58593.1 penicillin-binding protein [Exiguobacterium sp. SH3S1]TCI59629.1 penicillin-binding protein [Exiguobacterium sp. SH3S2]